MAPCRRTTGAVKTKILHIPTNIIETGAVVPAYNVPGISGEIKFTPEALAGIFLGKITNWNDPALAKVNPRVNFPNQPIIGFTAPTAAEPRSSSPNYLSKISKRLEQYRREANIGKVAGRYGRQG